MPRTFDIGDDWLIAMTKVVLAKMIGVDGGFKPHFEPYTSVPRIFATSVPRTFD